MMSSPLDEGGHDKHEEGEVDEFEAGVGDLQLEPPVVGVIALLLAR